MGHDKNDQMDGGVRESQGGSKWYTHSGLPYQHWSRTWCWRRLGGNHAHVDEAKVVTLESAGEALGALDFTGCFRARLNTGPAALRLWKVPHQACNPRTQLLLAFCIRSTLQNSP